MFVNRLFPYLTFAYLENKKIFYGGIFNILFLYEDEDIGRFSNLHKCIFNVKFLKFTNKTFFSLA